MENQHKLENCDILFTHHPLPVWIYDSDTLDFLAINKSATFYYGYSQAEFLERKLTDLYLPEDIPILLAYLAERPTYLPKSAQWRHICKNGQIICVEVVSQLINYANREARIAVIKDITDHKRMEVTLQDSEARFRAISQVIPISLFISRCIDGLIVYTNPEFVQTFQFSAVDLVNYQTLDLYKNPADRAKILEVFTQKGTLYNYEVQLKRADGTCFWAIACLRYLIFNGEKAILHIFHDITKRKDIETRLQEQIEFLQSIFQNIPLMIALNDAQGKVQWINQKFEQELGWNISDFQNTDVFTQMYPNAEYRQSVWEFIQMENPAWIDLRGNKRNGCILDTAWTSVKLPNGQTLSIGKDITDRKQNERMLKAQIEREKLMRTVSQRIRQSLNLPDILHATVEEIRDLLHVDRVVVYQFADDMSGNIVAESVAIGWTTALGKNIKDTCFQTGGGQDYLRPGKRAISNIYQAGLSDCHIQLLEQFEVKANLVVPIFIEAYQDNSYSCLWGLLIAHQCSGEREWEEDQLDLLNQLTVPIAIAIQQSIILQHVQNELAQRQKAEMNLIRALTEKEVLLKEVHHRVKNNLQIVSSLLQLQSHTIADPEVLKALRESQNRIESISLVHKNLYTHPNIGELNIAEYVNNLLSSLMTSYQILPNQVVLETYIDDVSLNLDQAIACGLVINELISNAIKHAFPDLAKGKITINLCTKNTDIQLTIQDNGIGLPDSLDQKSSTSLGLSLVYDLVIEQLEGNISVERHQGTKYNILFPQSTWQT